jgi:hypothetical protein
MKTFFSSLLVVMLILALSDFSWGQFPCNPGDSVGADCCGADSGDHAHSWDLGFCDTFHVVPWPETDTCFIACDFMGQCDTTCINNPGEDFPCFLYVPLLVTHDSNTFWWETESKWVQDSISALTIPLVWTRTNPSAYCSLSSYWNEDAMITFDPRFPRSIWRHFHPSEFDSNRMAWLAGQFQGLEWSVAALHLASDSSWFYYQNDSVFTPPRMWMGLIPSSPTNRRWWEGERTLLATLTFRIEDTMHVCLDTTWWPPGNHLTFCRRDARLYFPRHDLPLCVRVGPSPHLVTSPNGGEKWCVGKTEEITWSSEDFPDLFVGIEYSRNAGITWWPIGYVPNAGTYVWTIPDTPSDSCLVKVSDTDGDPYDESDNLFTIFLAGDANADAVVDIGDIVYLINYLFIDGSAPVPLEAGEVNLDGEVDTGDVVYLINFLFLDGPAPRC